MRKRFLYFLLFFVSIQVFLNTNSLHSQSYWIVRGGSSAIDEGADVSVNASGDVFATGYFSGTATFGPSATLSATGLTDIYVVKLNSQGVVQWAVSAGGMGPDRGISIKADGSGNCYVTGFFYGNAKFGSTSVSAVSGSQDIFVAKYNSSGTLQWVATAGGNSGDKGNGITVDNSGNVIVTGEFIGKADFGSLSLTSVTNPNTSAPSIDVFTAKYNASGTVQWVKQGAAPYTDRGLDVATDASGNVYVTGQFSDTITFENKHNNNMYNAIFLIKYNSSGSEQWFRIIGGSTQNIAYGIAVDANANVYLTGDFLSNILFFGTPNISLNGKYENNIFIAKYNTNGDYQWAKADGSASAVSARNIVLDNASNAYIIGNFECVFSDYADYYGQGTFNSIGFQDIFIAKYNSASNRQWARHIGGQQNDYGAGIAVNNSGLAHITGSFSQKIVFPLSTSVIGYNAYYNSYGPNPSSFLYCTDSQYGNFYRLDAVGNLDAFISNAIDLNRQPYDYYLRSGSACNRPFVGGCINNTGGESDCSNSATACGSTTLTAASKTGGSVGSVGPNFNYKWSTGGTSRSIYVTSSGSYFVKITSADGCFTSYDTIQVTINPFPNKPTISDSKGVNTNSLNPQTISFCSPDSVILTGGNTSTNTYRWTGPGLGGGADTLSITAKQTGWYYFTVTNSFGCTTTNQVYVNVMSETKLQTIDPRISLYDDFDKDDTVTLCQGQYYRMLVYDTIANPNANYIDIPNSTTTWTITPPGTVQSQSGSRKVYYPTSSGNYTVNASLTINTKNPCGGDDSTFNLTKSYYINVIPYPTVDNPITGTTTICENTSTTLYTKPGYSNTWSGPGIVSNTGDSVIVNKTGSYCVTSTKTQNGCSSAKTSCTYVSQKSPPAITMNPTTGLICPNDSVTLTATNGVKYEWYGPSGAIGGNTSTLKVNTVGYYFCVITDAFGCRLTSNTMETRQYNTPFLYAVPNTMICPGQSVVVNVSTNTGSIIEWQPPLSGSSTSKTISSAGTYICKITSCGIVTDAQVIITSSNVKAQIIPDGPTTFCKGDSVVLSGVAGMADYEWDPGDYHNPSFTVKQSGTVKLTTNDGNGCKDSTSIAIKVNNPQIIVDAGKDAAICTGDSTQLNAIGSTIYLWTPSEGLNDTTISNPIANPTQTTTYYVLAPDNNGCYGKDAVTITVNALPTVDAGTDTVACNNTPVHIGGMPTGPLGASYTWTPSAYLNDTLISNPDALPSTPQQYVVVVSDLNGCVNSDTVNVSSFIIQSSPDTSICKGDSTDISVSIQLGIGPYSYLWEPATDISNETVSNPVVYPSSTTTYNVSVTDSASGCVNTEIVNVTVNKQAEANFDLTLKPYCDYMAVTFNNLSTDADFYQWTFEDGSTSEEENTTRFYSYEQKASAFLAATNIYKCNDTTSLDKLILPIEQYIDIDIPNVFTPNEDGMNDAYKVEILNEIKACSTLDIYNRWGKKIFSSKEGELFWDGTSKSEGTIHAGTYFYILQIKDLTFKGTLTLIR